MKATDIIEVLETFVKNRKDLSELKKSLLEPQNEAQAQEFIIAVQKILKINIAKTLNDWELMTPLFWGEILTGVIQWLNYLYLSHCFDNAKNHLQLLALGAGIIGSIMKIVHHLRWRKSASLKIIEVNDQLLKFYSTEEMLIWKHKKIKAQLMSFFRNSGIDASDIKTLQRYAATALQTPKFVKAARELESDFIQNLKNMGKQSVYALTSTSLAFLFFKLNLLYRYIHNPGGGVVDFYAAMIVIFSIFSLKKNYEDKHFGPISIEWHRQMVRCYMENLQFNFMAPPVVDFSNSSTKKLLTAPEKIIMKKKQRHQAKTCHQKWVNQAVLLYRWSCLLPGFCVQTVLNYFSASTSSQPDYETDLDFWKNSSSVDAKKTIPSKMTNVKKTKSSSKILTTSDKKIQTRQSFASAGPIPAVFRNPEPIAVGQESKETVSLVENPKDEEVVDFGKISIHSSAEPIWKKVLPFGVAEQVDILWGTCQILFETNKKKSIELEQKKWELTQTKKALQTAEARLATCEQQTSAVISLLG